MSKLYTVRYKTYGYYDVVVEAHDEDEAMELATMTIEDAKTEDFEFDDDFDCDGIVEVEPSGDYRFGYW